MYMHIVIDGNVETLFVIFINRDAFKNIANLNFLYRNVTK